MSLYEETRQGFVIDPPDIEKLKHGRLDEKHSAQVSASRGEPVRYYQATRCSCTGEDGQPKISCSCESGFRYYDDPVESIVLFPSFTMEQTHGKDGVKSGGEVKAWIDRSIYRNDWSHLPKSQRYEDNTLYHSVHLGDVFVIPGKIRRKHAVLERNKRDSILDFEVHTVNRIFAAETEYFVDTDWVIDPTDPHNRTISWITSGPSKFYTVEYTCPLNLIVFEDVPQNIGGIDEKIGQPVKLKIRSWGDLNIKPDLTEGYEGLGMGVRD